MSDRIWTDEQKSAIYTSNTEDSKRCSLLVSAAAGSGKTAVLVERIIKKILPDGDKSGIDISKLLVVTFTNAAAQEMKDRVNSALSKELKLARANGDTPRIAEIKKQILLLSGADITTIDAFCMKTVRENFSVLDIDPGFSVADEGQAAILMNEAVEELFSRLFEEKNEEFLSLMDRYATASSHRALSELLKNVYSYTRSIPYPLEWLRQKTENLKYEEIPLSKSALYKRIRKSTSEKLNTLFKLAEKVLIVMCETSQLDDFIKNNPPEKSVEVYDEWGPAYKAFYFDYLLLRELVKSDCPLELIKNHSFSTLSFNKNTPDSQKNYIRYIRDQIKTGIKDIASDFAQSHEDAQKVSQEKIYPVALAICNLVSEFHKVYMEKKNRMNLLEFHDIEQITAELFSAHPEIAEAVRNRYDEILMDEYQDTSLLQEEIFSKIKKEDNVFMVGDMKQSIYRFRSSDPSIFKNKIDTFSEDANADKKKIILSNNFRSRGEVLASINDVFEAIMTETAGELNYDESQKLHLLKESYSNLGQDHISECIEIAVEAEDDSEENPDKFRAEARFIASEIIRLKSERFKVRDGDNYRDIENRDFAILLSKYKNVAEIYANELNDAGIDCYVESSGYFDQSEIRLMLSLLNVIINPYSDIPLIGVLRSPIASFIDDEIVTVRKCKKGKFYSALKEIVALSDSDKITDPADTVTANKAKAFLENLNRWRKYSQYMSTDKLIWTLYEETDFYAFCGAMYDGETMQANLRLLFLRAKQYEDNGFRGLFNFVKYIENLKKRDSDLSSAKLIGDSHDTVRIMSIHKSKGLEMPVVFIAGGGTDFNKSTRDPRIVLHKDYGIGLDLISYEHRYKTETLEKKMIKSVLCEEQISEEIRKLYVAMTRAREKLYFISSHAYDTLKSDSCEYTKKKLMWENGIENGTVTLTPFDVLSSKCYADWVMPVSMCSNNWRFRCIFSGEIPKPEYTLEIQNEDNSGAVDVATLLSYSYPYREATTLPTKVTVSELKQDSSTTMTPMPAFLKDNTDTGAFYGTAMHNFIKEIQLRKDMTPEYIENQLAILKENGVISEKEAKKINTDKIFKFFSSELGIRILNSNNVCREQTFEVSLPASLLYPDKKNIENETVILQGIIDCYFEEDDGLVLVDYKTDRFKSTDEIHQKYDLQLNLYSTALEKITQKKIKNKYFYLFFDDSVIQ